MMTVETDWMVSGEVDLLEAECEIEEVEPPLSPLFHFSKSISPPFSLHQLGKWD